MSRRPLPSPPPQAGEGAAAEGDSVLRAASVTISHCRCHGGAVHLRLHDREGNIFAVASLPAATASDAVDGILNEIQALLDDRGAFSCDGGGAHRPH